MAGKVAEEKYQCEYCDTKFRYLQNLIQHLKKCIYHKYNIDKSKGL